MIKPFEKQKTHIEQLIKIINKHKYAFDFSEPGSGKTYCASYILKNHFNAALIICPATVKLKWRGMKKQFNLPILDILSFQSFRGMLGREIKHRYLNRVDMGHYQGAKQIINTTFSATDKYKELIKNKFLIIIDEIQNIKNKSLAHEACRTAIKSILAANNSAVLMLSGIAFDNYKNIPLIMRLVGAQPCNYIEFMTEYMPEHMSRMEGNNEFKIKCRNYYMNVPNPELYNRELSELKNTDCEGRMLQQMRKIEIIKTELFIRRAREILRNPKVKLVIILNYTASVNIIYDALSNHNPSKLVGKTSSDMRDKVIREFQQPNNNLRLIVGNMRVLSSGIDLDDKTGKYPRYCIINKNFSALDQQQLYYRFKREDTKSNPHIEFIFANVKQREDRIIRCVDKKNNVISKLMNKELFYLENVYESE